MKNNLKKFLLWNKNLLIAYSIGIEDLFLASLKKIITLLLLIILPAIYGYVMSQAYWNPSANLNQIPIAIFDDDYSSINIQKTELDKNTGKYTYQMGSLINEENDSVIGSNGESLEKLDRIITKIENPQNPNKVLHTNTGDIIYEPGSTFVNVGNTWDMLKNLLIKQDANKLDEESKFSLKAAPVPSLQFKDIKYIKNKNKINNEFKNPKYLGQLKIRSGYQAELFKVLGLLFADDGTQESDQKIRKEIEIFKKDYNLEMWSTLQRNFVIGYLINTFWGFRSYLTSSMTPMVNNMEESSKEVKKFTIKGSEVKNWLSSDDQLWVQDNDTYYIKDNSSLSGEFKNDNYAIESTLFGNGKGNGKVIKWLNQLNAFSKDKMNLIEELMPDTYNFFNMILNSFNSETTKDSNDGFNINSAEKTLLYFLTGDQTGKTDFDNFIKKLSKNINLDMTKLNLDNIGNFFDESGIVNSKINTITGYISKFMQDNKEVFKGATSLYSLGSIYKQAQTTNLTHGFNVDDTYNFTMQGKKGNDMPIYGVGVGSVFFIAGLFMGANMIRGVVTRDKQYSKINFASWFMSKFMVFATIGFIQVTIECWFIFLVSWRTELSASTMALDYIWILQADIVLISAILCFQYLFSSAFLGAIFGIFFLLFNMAAGGGSYPAILEKQFFWDIHWILPFNYIMTGIDEINFGVALLGANHQSTSFLLEQSGILWGFIALFLSIGLFASYFRIRQVTYGSWIGNIVYESLILIKRDTAKQFRTIKKSKITKRKHYVYHWDVLRERFDAELYEAVRNVQRKRYGYSWYVKKRKKQRIKDNLVDR